MYINLYEKILAKEEKISLVGLGYVGMPILGKDSGLKYSDDVKPNFGPDKAGDIKHSNADISKAKTMLGYDPEWSFERGIEAAIEWYKENL